MDSKKVHYAALAGLLHDSILGKDFKSEVLSNDLLKEIEQIPEEIIALADQLSAGSTSRPTPKVDESRQLRLVSIFSLIEIQEGGKTQRPLELHYWPINQLSVRNEKSLFPVPSSEVSDVESQVASESLLSDFQDGMRALKESQKDINNLEVYLESVMYLLQQYAWCIPSGCYPDMFALSVCDHGRMTAALAAILSDNTSSVEFIRETSDAPEKSEADVALLIGGDISGVQDFIYTITNKGATSALRGRSFYLQLLTEAAARLILRELELPITNIIYAGGANFYILARPSDSEKLRSISQKIGQILYKHHRGDLYLAIEAVNIQAKEFLPAQDNNAAHPLSDKWSEVARKLSKAKNQRFSIMDPEELSRLFLPQGHGGNDDELCKVCGREHPGTSDWEKPEEGLEPVKKCPQCHSYEVLGDRLRDAKYVAWRGFSKLQEGATSKGNDHPAAWDKVINDLGFDVSLPFNKFNEAPSDGLIWALIDDAFANAQPGTFQIVVRRFLVNVTPRLGEDFTDSDGQKFEKDKIKPFEKMAKESVGINRLGVLRMDVDNLGQLFAKGLKENSTLSRIASLSFAVGMYFEGWVGQLAQERNNQYGDKLYAIYSGGDDLFFVGAWDQVVELAFEIRNGLSKYTGGHPAIHASAGIAIVGEKYPLAKAANDAARFEEQAKKYEWWDESGKHTKNVINFLGQPLSWEMFTRARTLMERISEDAQEKRHKSVIRTLLVNYAQYSDAENKRRRAGKDRNKQDKPQVLYGPWNWRIFYALRRNKADGSITNEIHDNPAMLEWLGVAARWAELKLRK